MKSVNQLLDDLIYSRDDADPRTKFFRNSAGVEIELDDEMILDLQVERGPDVESRLVEETGLDLDGFLTKCGMPT